MENKTTPNKVIVPMFLTNEPSDETKEHVKLAYVKYLRDNGKTPKGAMNEDINLKKLLVYLQELDESWMNIPPSEIKTSPPRTLIQRLNVILTRWKTNTDKVQKALDNLP